MKIRIILDIASTVILCTWVILRLISWDAPPKAIEENQIPEQLENIWKNLKQDNLVHGTILIFKDDQLIFSDGEKDKSYAIASLSKSFVGYRFFELKQSGLSLATPVCHWLKNFCQPELERISLQHLLDHRSGLGRDLSLWHFATRSFSPDWNIKNIDSLKLQPTDLHSTPGNEFRYSNFGYLVLSRVLEIIDQKNFGEIISALAKTANLNETKEISRNSIFPIYHLIPYTGLLMTTEWDTNLYRSAGTGGIQASARDVAQWLNFLEKKNFNQVLTEDNKDYSHGWTHSKKTSYQAYWHNGASIGSYSLMVSIPTSKIRIVVLEDQINYTKQWTNLAEKFEEYFY
jgi:CubicO group peptidase (beta-lactamase class C family)